MPRRLLRNPAVLISFGATLAWGACVLWAPVDALNYGLRIGIASCSAAAMARYGKAAWSVYREGARHPEDSLILGIFIVSTAFLYYSGYSILSRATGGPDWLNNSPWSAFYPFLVLTAFLLVVTATRFDGENGSVVRTLSIGALTFFGFLFTTLGHFLWTAVEIALRFIPH